MNSIMIFITFMAGLIIGILIDPSDVDEDPRRYV